MADELGHTPEIQAGDRTARAARPGFVGAIQAAALTVVVAAVGFMPFSAAAQTKPKSTEKKPPAAAPAPAPEKKKPFEDWAKKVDGFFGRNVHEGGAVGAVAEKTPEELKKEAKAALDIAVGVVNGFATDFKEFKKHLPPITMPSQRAKMFSGTWTIPEYRPRHYSHQSISLMSKPENAGGVLVNGEPFDGQFYFNSAARQFYGTSYAYSARPVSEESELRYVEDCSSFLAQMLLYSLKAMQRNAGSGDAELSRQFSNLSKVWVVDSDVQPGDRYGHTSYNLYNAMGDAGYKPQTEKDLKAGEIIFLGRSGVSHVAMTTTADDNLPGFKQGELLVVEVNSYHGFHVWKAGDYLNYVGRRGYAMMRFDMFQNLGNGYPNFERVPLQDLARAEKKSTAADTSRTTSGQDSLKMNGATGMLMREEGRGVEDFQPPDGPAFTISGGARITGAPEQERALARADREHPIARSADGAPLDHESLIRMQDKGANTRFGRA